MRKLVVAAVCALTIVVIAPTTAAQGAADRCASKAEYRKITKGMSKAKVIKIVGYRGQRTFKFDQHETREFASCQSKGGFVNVYFENGRVTQKYALWG